MRLLRHALLLILLPILSLSLQAAGPYFFDHFTTLNPQRWYTNNLWLGREGYRPPTTGNVFSLSISGNSEIQHVGRISGNNSDDGAWLSEMTLMTQKRFTASTALPLGVCWKNTYYSYAISGATGNVSRTLTQDLWMVQDNKPSVEDYKVFGNNFANFLLFFHKRQDEFNDSPSFFGGYVNGIEHPFDLTQARRADGIRTVNLSSLAGFTVDSRISTDTNLFMITHDGRNVSFYVNPNPNNRAALGLPNEFCLVYQDQVTWADNIRFGFGAHSRDGGTGYWDARYDYISVRSAADGCNPYAYDASDDDQDLVASTNAMESERKLLRFVLNTVITPSNAGIRLVTIDKPANWGPWATASLSNEIIVRTAYRDGVNLSTNVVRPYVRGGGIYMTNIATNQVAVYTNGNQLWIRLGKGITPSFTEKRIEVYARLLTPIAEDNVIYTFPVTVNAPLFAPVVNNQTNFSTGGPQYGSGGNNYIRLTSEVKGPAEAYASIVPGEIIQGNNAYSFTLYLQSTEDDGLQDISQAAIMVPGSFVMQTNSIDSFKINNDAAYISVVDGSVLGLSGAGTNFILINYAGANAKLAAGGEMDILTFSIKGDSSKGIWQWRTWVSGGILSPVSLQATTNEVFLSQKVRVLGAPPNVEGGIVSAATPKILFNTVSVSTLQYRIRNAASADQVDNRIYDAVISLPAVFTNVTVLTSTRALLSGISKGILYNTTVFTLRYYGNAIPPGGTFFDTITLRAVHSLSAGQTTNVSMTALVNNSNGQGFMPQAMSLVTNILITDPQPIATADITVDDGIVYTSDTVNDFTCNIYNSGAPTAVLTAFIDLPGTHFVSVTNYSSAWPGAVVSRSGLTLRIDYPGPDYLTFGSQDAISFTAADSYTNYAVAGQVVVPSRVANASKTNSMTDRDAGLGLVRTVFFVPQGARVHSYITNGNIVDTAVSNFSLYYIIRNTGDPGNMVSFADLTFSGSGGGGAITAITKATSLLGGIWDSVGLTVSKSSYGLNGGQMDVLRIDFEDTIVNETYRDLIPRVTVNTSFLRPTTKPAGKTNRLYFQTPPPVISWSMTPGIAYTGLRTNTVVLNVKNEGQGSNGLDEVIVILPVALHNMAAGVSSSSGGTVTTYEDRVVVSYAAKLAAQAADTVTLTLVSTIGTKSSVFWKAAAVNNDGKGPRTNATAARMDFVVQPQAGINPTRIWDASRTNRFS